MATTLNPYLNFGGNAREAMTFYQGALGGDLSISTFGEMDNDDPAEANLVMHAALTTPSGFNLFAADTPASMGPATGFSGFNVSISGDAGDELRGYWDKLSEGATVTMPLERAPWGDEFGMLTDRFGVGWMVNVSQPT
jgi:PhnB protein